MNNISLRITVLIAQKIVLSLEFSLYGGCNFFLFFIHNCIWKFLNLVNGLSARDLSSFNSVYSSYMLKVQGS